MSSPITRIADPRERYTMIPPPSGPLTWLSGAMLVIIIALATVAFLIDYPTSRAQDVVIVSDGLPVPVVARVDGTLRMVKVKEGDTVSEGEVLSYLHNDVRWEDIRELKSVLEKVEVQLAAGEGVDTPPLSGRFYGEMQQDVLEFHRLCDEYGEYRSTVETMDRDRLRRLLGSNGGRRGTHGISDSLSEEIYELERKLVLNRQERRNRITAVARKLLSQIGAWEESHLIKAPVDGIVSLFRFWTDMQYVRSGEELLTITPRSSHYTAKAFIPQEHIPDVRIGDAVEISIPALEQIGYGMFNGRITTIAGVPREGTYAIDIAVDSLRSSDRERIPFKPWMRGTMNMRGRKAGLLDLVQFFPKPDQEKRGAEK